MQGVQRLLFLLGGLALLLAIGVEFGSMLQLGDSRASIADMPRPGIGIPYLAALDLLLVYTLVMLSTDMLGPLKALISRVQGIVTFILSLIGLLALLVMIFAAFGMLVLMVSLFTAVPFGTLVYMGVWSQFDTHDAHILLAMAMFFKLVAGGLLIVSRPTVLKNVNLLLLLGTSLLATLLLAILQSWPPGFLVSITDALGALVIGVAAAIWTLIFLIDSIPAIIVALRSLLRTS